MIEEAVVIKNINEETLYIGNENIFEVQSEFIGQFVYSGPHGTPNKATQIYEQFSTVRTVRFNKT